MLFMLASCQVQTPQSGFSEVHHVLVIGVDGLSPDGIRHAHTPAIDQLIATGAHTMVARGVMPTSSGPNWASVLMGAGPEQHGVTSNAFNPDEPTLPPTVSGSGSRRLFPTIFDVLHTDRPSNELCAIFHWETISSYFEPEHVDHVSAPGSDEGVALEAARYLPQMKPLYCFLHLDDVDQAGHSFGHGSAEYYESVSRADSLVGQVIHALDESGMRSNTLILLTADHGGKGYGHNENVPEVIRIPYIINGPHVKRGFEITETVSIIDHAPTVAFALGVPVPEAWTGQPVLSPFEGYEAPGYVLESAVFYRKPVIYPEGDDFGNAGGLFLARSATVSMSNPNPLGEIRYTTDGNEPTNASRVYTDPFDVSQTTVVRAAVFHEGERKTSTNTAYYRLVENPAGRGTRIQYYYGAQLDSLPDFSQLQRSGPPGHTYEFSSAEMDFSDGADQLAVRLTSYIQIDVAGEYTFTTASDDGSKLYINGDELVDNDGNHGVRERSGTVTLPPGFHEILVTWYNSGGGLWLRVYFEGPDIPRQILSSDRLYVDASG